MRFSLGQASETLWSIYAYLSRLRLDLNEQVRHSLLRREAVSDLQSTGSLRRKY